MDVLQHLFNSDPVEQKTHLLVDVGLVLQHGFNEIGVVARRHGAASSLQFGHGDENLTELVEL